MQTYTVYEPRPAPENIRERADRLVFIKEGFSFLAFLFTPFWLLGHRLWLYAAIYFLVIIGISVIGQAGGDEVLSSLLALAVNLIVGFEARDLYRRSLEQKGYVLRAVVSGRSLAECEYRFLREWLPDARSASARLTAMPQIALPGNHPKSDNPAAVIGIFPAHGG